MELTTSAGMPGSRPGQKGQATCEEAWFRCPSCRKDLGRLPWVLDLPGTLEAVTIDVWPAGVRAPYELPVAPRLGVRQIAAILGRTIRSTYALTPDFDDAGLRLPGRDLFVRTVPFFEWLHSHPRLRSRAETLADRDRRRVSSGGFLKTGPRPASRGQGSRFGGEALDSLVV
jgi:hypothetical protein